MIKNGFRGFMPQTAEFFMGIAFNNNKEYFEMHRHEFELYIKQPLLCIAKDIQPLMDKIDDELETRPMQDKALARIRRDTRFSKDESPYRDYLWLGYKRIGEANNQSIVFYVSVSAFEVKWGMGLRAPHKPCMDKVRTQILNKPAKFKEALKAIDFEDRFTKVGQEYKRPVVKHDDKVIADWCNRKNFAVVHGQVFDSKVFEPSLVQEIMDDFIKLAPLYRLLRGLPDTHKKLSKTETSSIKEEQS